MFEWFTASGEHIFWSEICNVVTYVSNNDPEHQVVVGCDSHIKSNKTTFVVAVCLVSSCLGYERLYFYGKTIKDNTTDFYSRIFQEVNGATLVALSLKEYSSSSLQKANITIHLDVSSSEKKTRTAKYSNDLTAFVKANGFNDVQIKPNSWASSSIADKHTK